jgi:coproporphyrinogen III oxidase
MFMPARRAMAFAVRYQSKARSQCTPKIQITPGFHSMARAHVVRAPLATRALWSDGNPWLATRLATAAVTLTVGAGCWAIDSHETSAQMEPAPHTSRSAVLEHLTLLQAHFVRSLEHLDAGGQRFPTFRPLAWARNAGASGGGVRFGTGAACNDAVFNQASVNVSSVHYEDVSTANVDSATALSVILHPRNPYAPSMHFHVSYMEPRGSPPYWRMMADLNPAIEDATATAVFEDAVRGAMPVLLHRDAKVFGDKYFNIPALGRARGSSHMFVAKLDPGSEMAPAECVDLANELAERAIGAYCELVQGALHAHPMESITASDRAKQLAYHTMYLFQVLTLDRGTTHGLLAHNDNDIGTLGSLPSAVDGALLASWKAKLAPPQDLLLQRIIDVLPARDKGVSEITTPTRAALAATVRQYYREDMTRTRKQADMDMKWWAEQTPRRLEEACVPLAVVSDRAQSSTKNQ